MKIDKPIDLNLTEGTGSSFMVVVYLLKIQHRVGGYFLLYTFLMGILLTGCINTEGIIEIKGKVIDEYTEAPIPGRGIIIQGLVLRDDVRVPIYAGQFSADSSGCFTYSLKKVKDAYSYNFCFVGDTNYVSTTKEISLSGLERNRKYLSFSLNKLVDFTIKINKISKTPATLIMSLKSDGIDGRVLYPYKIENYGLTSNLDLIWIGVNVKSTIKTRVFADKRTTVRWVLYQNMKMKEIIDTITCKRGLVNVVYLKY